VLLIALLFLSILQTVPVKASSRTIVVPDDYPSIQEAVNAANPGDFIYVKSGNYNESIEIRKSISIVGNRTNIYGKGEVGIRIQANNVSIEGFIVYNCSCAIELKNSKNCVIRNIMIKNNDVGLHLIFSSANITRNIIENNRVGVWFSGSTNSVVEENEINENTWGVVAESYQLRSSSGNTIRSNNFTSNRKRPLLIIESSSILVDGNYFAPNQTIVLHEASNCNLTRNLIEQCLICLEGSSENYILQNMIVESEICLEGYQVALTTRWVGAERNLIENNTFVGSEIRLFNAKHNTIRNNNFMNGQTAIILDERYKSTSIENLIIGNKIRGYEKGVEIRIGGNKITRNVFIENGIGLSVTTSANFVYNNDFIENERQVYVGGKHFWTGNYWSDYNGKDLNNDGIGDEPYVINENNKDPYPLMKPHEYYKELPKPKIVRRGINVTVSPTRVTVETWETALFTVNITNIGSLEEELTIRVFKDPEYYSGSPFFERTFMLKPFESKVYKVRVSAEKGVHRIVFQVGVKIIGIIDPSFGPYELEEAKLIVKEGKQQHTEEPINETANLWILVLIVVVIIAIAVVLAFPTSQRRIEDESSRSISSFSKNYRKSRHFFLFQV